MPKSFFNEELRMCDVLLEFGNIKKNLWSCGSGRIIYHNGGVVFVVWIEYKSLFS